MLELNFTHNGVLMLKPTEDKEDFAVFFPIEFMSDSNLNYSWRWIYSDPKPTSMFYSMKHLFENVSTGLEA